MYQSHSLETVALDELDGRCGHSGYLHLVLHPYVEFLMSLEQSGQTIRRRYK
jgi:hypothetical protein